MTQESDGKSTTPVDLDPEQAIEQRLSTLTTGQLIEQCKAADAATFQICSELFNAVDELMAEREKKERKDDHSAMYAIDKAIVLIENALQGKVRKQTGKTGIGWPELESENLAALKDAAHNFWSSYDPGQPDTAPKSEDVADYLIRKHHVPGSLAKSMAAILRPSTAPLGRRPGAPGKAK